MKAVLMMAYGSPRSLDEVEAYYTHIRGGRKPSEGELENLKSRYKAIGGASPLLDITNRQVDALQAMMRRSGSSTRVYAAMKHSHPFISEVMEKVGGDGVDSLLCVALAPHYSYMSVGSYMKTVEEANSKLNAPIRLEFIRSWHNHQEFLDAWEKRVRRVQSKIDDRLWFVFSAHSLPERIIAEGDPYKDQLLETSRLVADRLQTTRWSFTFQSASHTREPWLGPDILEHLDSLYAKGERRFILAPIGFLSDHLEILYDIDVECRSWADGRGAQLARCDLLNDSEDLIRCLHSLAQSKGFV